MTTSTVSETVEHAPKRVKAAILRVLAGSAHPRLEIGSLAHRYNMTAEDVKQIATMHGGIEQPARMLKAAAILEGHPESDDATPAPRGPATSITVPTAASPVQSAATPVGAYDLGGLFKRAAASGLKRTRSKGEKLQALVDELTVDLRQEDAAREAAAKAAEEQAAAAREVAELERKLAEAKAKLRGGKPSAPAKRPAGGVHNVTGPTAQTVRAWAASKGIDCPKVGRVPKGIVDQYLAEHDGGAE